MRCPHFTDVNRLNKKKVGEGTADLAIYLKVEFHELM